jgi:hypothetical protein
MGLLAWRAARLMRNVLLSINPLPRFLLHE